MKISIFPALILTVLIVTLPGLVYGLGGVTGYTDADCLECHDEMVEDHTVSVHRDIPCLECHAQAVEEDHERLEPVHCALCHTPHTENRLHDAHTRVSCMACHVKEGIPAIDPDSKNIIFSGKFRPAMDLPIHQAIGSQTEEHCGMCHFKGNELGASTMALPAKSILCMPCHVATFSVGDKTSLVSLFICIIGFWGLAFVWFSGSMNKRASMTPEKVIGEAPFRPHSLFPDNVFQLLKNIFADVVLLKQLFLQSPTRWIIHALIFFPFIFRFSFGLAALLFSIFLPDGSVTIAMLDKNHVMRAIFFDVTGLMIFAGCMAAIVSKGRKQNKQVTSLPGPGPVMPAMIGLIVLVGFILEGVRIAMTGWIDGSEWAFAGYGISLLCKGMTGLTDIYGYVWYAHAILTGVFIALIPFTRMIHIITAPIVLIMNARSRAKACCRKNKI